MPHTPDHQDSNEFGYIYDWMDQYETPESLVGTDKDELLLELYNTMTSGLEKPLSFDKWKEIYGRYVDSYNPAQEELTQEAFDIKVGQTEDLFSLKTEQEERNYALIEKYNTIDDSDDFESSTEMAIRHSEETKIIDDKLNRYNLITKGLDLTGKMRDEEHKSLLKNLRSGDVDALTDELNESFWSSMKVVRSQYDQKRLKSNQALDNLLLKSEQTVDSAFAAKKDSIQSSLITAQNNMQNAAVDLLQDKVKMHEEYDEGLWNIMGELASNDAFEAECTQDSDCAGDNYVCHDESCVYDYQGVYDDDTEMEQNANDCRNANFCTNADGEGVAGSWVEYESGGGQCNCPSGDVDLGTLCMGYTCANGDCVSCGDKCSPQECVQPFDTEGMPTTTPGGISIGSTLPDCNC